MGLGKGAWGNHLVAFTQARDSDWAFAAYQDVRHRLPEASFDQVPLYAADLTQIADRFDVFLLDAFGVLNVGEQAIPGAVSRVAELQAAGKRVMVVTNAAGYPKRLLMQRYQRLGFTFDSKDVVSSREALLFSLTQKPPIKWGLMASKRFGTEEIEHLDAIFLKDDPSDYDAVDGFLFFGSAEWTEARQRLLTASIANHPRPLLVGNPDIVAPVEGGLSREPGYFAHRIADETGIRPAFCGKPFGDIFEMAFNRLPDGIQRNRIVMVGDTLHTDILGGRAAGVRTALVTDYGSLKGADVKQAIVSSGIRPDFILQRP
jgi:HAD superfamily hydrolase (TIGR01459 family)